MIRVISFTKRGRALSLRLQAACLEEMTMALYCKSKTFVEMASMDEKEAIIAWNHPLEAWTKWQFDSNTPMIFIGSSGIAVRSIAPFIKDKLQDPAVLVMDEAGQFVIPILSGHYGGANVLAKTIARKLGATAVITTATDVNHLFAVDVFAKNNNLVIANKAGIKEVSSNILAKKVVTIAIDGTYEGLIPPELTLVDHQASEISIYVSPSKREHAQVDVWLVPKSIILGIGCRKGKTSEEIEDFVVHQLNQMGLAMEAVVGIASIDLKKEEPGLYKFAAKYQLPFTTFTKEELMDVAGAFTPSSFVQIQTGVDNVCERAAMALGGSEAGLLLEKQAKNGITLAIASKKWRVSFE